MVARAHLVLLAAALVAAPAAARSSERCYSHAMNDYYQDGDSWTEPGCKLARCSQGYPVFDECKEEPLHEHCVWQEGDLEAEYPACCRQQVCKLQISTDCFAPALNRDVPHGHEWTEAGCTKAECVNGRVGRIACGLVGISGPDCEIVPGDESAPYPGCCHHQVCKKGCFAPALNRTVPHGHKWAEVGCTQSVCNDGAVGRLPCGLLAPPAPGCEFVPGDQSLAYPQCCGSFDCSKPCKEGERRFAVGEKWTLPGCTGQATCGGPGIVSAVGCPLVGIRSGVPCALDDGDPDSEDYPRCCPRIACPACNTPALKRTPGPGDEWTEPGCVLSRCEVIGGLIGGHQGVAVLHTTCKPVEAPPPHWDCRQVVPSSDQYPDCCPAYQCADNCYSEARGTWFAVGEKWVEKGNCGQFHCEKGADGFANVFALPCPLVGGPDYSDCHVTDVDSTKLYPDCCPSFECTQHCVTSKGNIFAVGETWTEEGCTLFHCQLAEDGTPQALPHLECGLIAIDPNPYSDCRLVVRDPSAEHPACCPEVDCEPVPENTCYSAAKQRYFQPGDKWLEPPCDFLTCREGGGISGKGCGLQRFRPGSQCVMVPGEPGTDHCCPRPECPDPHLGRVCYSEPLKRWVDAGEEWLEPEDDSTSCSHKTCQADGSIDIQLCPPPIPGCEVHAGDPTSFPACCPESVCPEVDPVPY